MQKSIEKDAEYIFYESQLKQNKNLNLSEDLIKTIINKIKNQIFNENYYFQFALDPSTKAKSVMTTQDIKANDRAFIVNHVATFGIKEIRNVLDRQENIRNIFETIVSDSDPNLYKSLKDQKPKINSLKDYDQLRKFLAGGNLSLFYFSNYNY